MPKGTLRRSRTMVQPLRQILQNQKNQHQARQQMATQSTRHGQGHEQPRTIRPALPITLHRAIPFRNLLALHIPRRNRTRPNLTPTPRHRGIPPRPLNDRAHQQQRDARGPLHPHTRQPRRSMAAHATHLQHQHRLQRGHTKHLPRRPMDVLHRLRL